MARPRFLRAIYPGSPTATCAPRSDADRRVRDVGIATTRQDPGLRAVSELWGSFASPEHDLRAEAASIAAPTLVALGQARSGDPAEGRPRAGGDDPGRRARASSTPATRPRSATRRGSPPASCPFAEAAFAQEPAAAKAAA